jgi:threonine/homoserine/homoserine lactone efflux protein
MSWEVWVAFVLVGTGLALTPGPAVLFVVSTALRHGGRRSVWASAGILSGNAFYFALSAVGLGAVLITSHDVFTVLKWCGAAYLVFLGLRLIFAPSGRTVEVAGTEQPVARLSGWGILRQGFALQAANPKALVFFVALLPQFIDPTGHVAGQIAILGVTSVVTEFFVLVGYGFAAGRLSAWAKRPSVARATDRVAGTLLVGAGVGVGLSK